MSSLWQTVRSSLLDEDHRRLPPVVHATGRDAAEIVWKGDEMSETTEQVEVTEPADGGQSPPELRAALDRERDKAKKLTQLLARQQLESLGLEADTGFGKALMEKFDGDITEDGALAAFAKEHYGWEPTGTSTAQPEPAATAAAAQTRSEQVQAATVPEPAPQPINVAEEAEKVFADPATSQDDVNRAFRGLANELLAPGGS